ncbi:MAG TPA: hypothetical protein VK747_10095 [Blastocatellia bacterium]|nr:hypothetical protein [Blastocatellia bacterium]
MNGKREGGPAKENVGPIGIAPSDATHLEKAATALLAAFKPDEVDSAESTESWTPDLPVAGNLTYDHSMGPMWRGRLDEFGRHVEYLAFLSKSGIFFGLDKEGLASLDLLAEEWARNAALSGLSTWAKMRERLLHWCWLRIEARSDVTSASYILSDLNSDLSVHEVWVQIAGLDVEDRVPVGVVELVGVTSERVAAWSQAIQASPEKQERARATYRKTWQGRTAAVYRGRGDTSAVAEAAIEHAERACGLLRVVDPRSTNPTTRSCLQPLTLSGQVTMRELLYDPQSPRPLMSSIPAPYPPYGVGITRTNLRALWERASLRDIHALLLADPCSPFQADLIRAALIHSRQRLSTDPIEKLVFAITALEAILFAGKRGLYQDTLCRRLCGLLAGKEPMREHIAKTVQEAYRLRSQFLHHGQRLENLRTIEDLLLLSWLLFTRTLANQGSWNCLDDFCSAMDTDYKSRFPN